MTERIIISYHKRLCYVYADNDLVADVKPAFMFAGYNATMQDGSLWRPTQWWAIRAALRKAKHG